MTTLETETGTATLNDDGTMLVDNSGYKQLLSVEQVQAAWSGNKVLPLSKKDLNEMMSDGLTEEEANQYAPTYDGEYWDFGEEVHIIPSKDEFL